jgi:bacterioferritin (cytochrome b1)
MKISEDLGGLKSAIGNLTSSVETRQKADDYVHRDTAIRIQKLEENHRRIKWMATGAAAVVAGLWRVLEAVINSVHH